MDKIIDRPREAEIVVGRYPLSYQQERVWFILQMYPDMGALWNINVQNLFELNVDKDLLSSAYQMVIQRHAVLRTRIESKDGVPVQVVEPQVDADLIFVDLRSVKEQKQEVQRVINSHTAVEFDLSKAPLSKLLLIQREESLYVVCHIIHHIISDALSTNIFMQELQTCYQALKRNDQPSLPKLTTQYYEYANWQKNHDDSDEFKAKERYWLNKLKGEISGLNLPYETLNTKGKNFKGKSQTLIIDSTLAEKIQRYCVDSNLFVFTYFLTAYGILLHKYSGQNDIVIGSPFKGRNESTDLSDLIGFFINNIVFRLHVDSDSTQIKLLQEAQQQVKESMQFQDYPFQLLVDKLGQARNMERNPLFDISINFISSNEKVAFNSLQKRIKSKKIRLVENELAFKIYNSPSNVTIEVEYMMDRFSDSTVTGFLDHFEKIISKMVSDNVDSGLDELQNIFFDEGDIAKQNGSNGYDSKVSDIEILSEEERTQLLVNFNNTSVDYPINTTIIQVFEEQVRKTPKNIALIFESEEISYESLAELIDHLAGYLQDRHHIGLEDLVGIKLERSEWMLISILAVLKAGGAYVPIDPTLPKERVAYIEKDIKAKVCIDGQELEKFKKYKRTHACRPIKSMANARNLAYVIYTSGSTGVPKGVMVEHGSVMNRLFWMQKHYKLTDQDVLLQKTPISFDVSVWELFWWFFSGSKLYILKPGEEKEPEAIVSAIKKNKVSIIHFVPSMFSAFLQHVVIRSTQKDLNTVRHVFCSGEELKVEHVELFQKQLLGTRLSNLYGPTEATVDVSYYDCLNSPYQSRVPIGQPIDNLKLYVLDERQSLVPRGVSGELYISGVGVARGYLNNDKLTQECFLDDPFYPSERMYKTGDFVRWLPSGKLEYLGRVDDQVKIRGFRIELGEIEHQISAYPLIQEVVVSIQEENEDKFLVCYYVSGGHIDEGLLEIYLEDRLPDYMIPGHFVEIDKMPLTPNGKINKLILPNPTRTIGPDYESPSGALEEGLVALWSEVLVLDEEQIGVTSSFFDLGGHSLKATVLSNKIFKSLGVEVPLKELFKHQNIRSLSKYISNAKKSIFQPIIPVEPKPYYALSSAQQRMYFLYEFDKDSLAYNMPQVVRLEGELDQERLQTAFQRLIERHESLRTSFKVINEQTVQVIDQEVDFKIEHYECKEAHIPTIISNFTRPFDLSQTLLIRVGLIKVDEDIQKSEPGFILMVDMHHIVADGVSQGIMVRDFMSLYNNESLPELSLQYKDFAAWQLGSSQQEVFDKQKEFWLDQFLDGPEALDLPNDFARPLNNSGNGNYVDFTIESKEFTALKAMADHEGTTMFMIVLSLFNVLLSKLSNQQDVVVGTPVAGRQHADLETMMGMFVNTLALRNQPNGDLTFTAFVSAVREKTLACFEYQSYQYEELIEELNMPRNTDRNPLFDVMFSYENFERSLLEIPGLILKPYGSRHTISKFDLTLTVTESEDQLFLNFLYSTALFKHQTVERFAAYFKKIVTTIVASPNIKLESIEIILDAEKHQILNQFNKPLLDNLHKETVLDLFDEQVKKNPDNIALKYGAQEVTYLELKENSDKVAFYLGNTLDLKPGDMIGLMLEREVWMITFIFGILKVGGVYVAVNPTYPVARVNSILRNSKPNALITRGQYIDTAMDSVDQIVDLDQKLDTIMATDPGNFTSSVKGNDLAYVIYTSGSTGEPKGVMVEHRSLLNIIQCMQAKYPLNKHGNYLFKTSFSFDVSISEIFGWFLDGGSLSILPPDLQGDSQKVIEAIQQYKVTHINFVPSMFAIFLDSLDEITLEKIESLKYVFLCGEALTGELVNKCNALRTSISFENIYGPTEGTLYSTGYSIKEYANAPVVSIGKPLDNVKLYILSDANIIQPVGIIGELCVGGVGVSRGYLSKEKLTEEKFVENPFSPGEKMYRTGDLARWALDGNIDFLGRKDDQVKIRGFRIELGEIQHHLNNHDQINQVTLVANEKNGDKYLIAYYLAEEELQNNLLIDYLSDKVPDYMVPSFFVHLDKFPLNNSGKINRKALPIPEMVIEAEYVAPSDDIELRLSTMWSTVLNLEVEKISVAQSFFELGGHSLTALILMNLINKEFGIDIPLRMFFGMPFIRDLGLFIKNLTNNEAEAEFPDEEEEYTF